jgi:hypothetical protein
MSRPIDCSVHLNSILPFVHRTSMAVDLFRNSFRPPMRSNKLGGLISRYCIGGHSSRYRTAYFHRTISAKVTISCHDTSQLPNRDIQVIYMLAQVFWQVFWQLFMYSLRRRRGWS